VFDGRLDFLLRRPDVAQKDRLSARVLAYRLVVQVDVHPTGEGVRHNERRRRQVIRSDFRLDPAFEIAVAAQDSGNNQVVLFNRLGDRGGQRAAVADQVRAAVTHEMDPVARGSALRPASIR